MAEAIKKVKKVTMEDKISVFKDETMSLTAINTLVFQICAKQIQLFQLGFSFMNGFFLQTRLQNTLQVSGLTWSSCLSALQSPM